MDCSTDLLENEIKEIRNNIKETTEEQNANEVFSKILFVLSLITPMLVTLYGNFDLRILLSNYIIFGTPIFIYSKILKTTASKNIKKVEKKKQYVRNLMQVEESKENDNKYTKTDLIKLKASLLATSFYEVNKDLVIRCALEDKLYLLVKEYITNDTETILYICVEFRKLIQGEKQKSLLKK